MGLALWRVDRPLQIRARLTGFQPNGDIYRSATVVAYGCPGVLQLTLISKEPEPLNLYRDGRLLRSLRSAPPEVLHFSIPSRPGAGPTCSFGVTTTGLLGSTVVEFAPS